MSRDSTRTRRLTQLPSASSFPFFIARSIARRVTPPNRAAVSIGTARLRPSTPSRSVRFLLSDFAAGASELTASTGGVAAGPELSSICRISGLGELFHGDASAGWRWAGNPDFAIRVISLVILCFGITGCCRVAEWTGLVSTLCAYNRSCSQTNSVSLEFQSLSTAPPAPDGWHLQIKCIRSRFCLRYFRSGPVEFGYPSSETSDRSFLLLIEE